LFALGPTIERIPSAFQVVGMVMAIGPLKLLDADAEESCGLPKISPPLHQPSCRGVPQSVRRDLGHAGLLGVAAECLVDACDRRAVKFDRIALPKPPPASQMRQKPPGQRNRRLTFFCFLAACRPPVEDSAFEVDIARAGDTLERCAADCAGACASIEP